MKYVKLTMNFTVRGGSDLDAHTDLVMDELLNLEECDPNLHDADVSATLTDQQVSITIVALGDTFETAHDIAATAIRTAIHAAGGSTPSWEQPVFDPTSSAAELVSA
jgi:hypothetical protein